MRKLILTGLACIAALSMSIPVFASETRTSHHSANCSENRRCTDDSRGKTPVVPTAGWMRIMTVSAIISQMMTKTGNLLITVPAKAQMRNWNADTTREEADATIINSGRKGAYMRSEQDARRVIDLYSATRYAGFASCI